VTPLFSSIRDSDEEVYVAAHGDDQGISGLRFASFFKMNRQIGGYQLDTGLLQSILTSCQGPYVQVDLWS
jgi:hypothetical protein